MSDGLENARLSRVEREDCPAEFLEAYDEVIRSRGRTSMPNVFALLANSPGALAAVTPVGAHVRYGTSFDDALREYVILTVAQELRCSYEWGHHWEFALKVGAPEDMLKKVGTPAIEAEAGLVGMATTYARLVTRNEEVGDDMVEALKVELGNDGFVDLTIMIGYYGMLARFINTMRLQLEEGSTAPPFNV
ncbi:MAG: carboxymuconolactone decarboxylase family protein [Alphaproteobacteria bacterium]